MRLRKQNRKGGEAPITEHPLSLLQLLFLITIERFKAVLLTFLDEETRAEQS